jgi:hypothetical protein
MKIEYDTTLCLQHGLIEQVFLRNIEGHNRRVTRPWRFFEVTVLEGKIHPVEVELEKVVGQCGNNELEIEAIKVNI